MKCLELTKWSVRAGKNRIGDPEERANRKDDAQGTRQISDRVTIRMPCREDSSSSTGNTMRGAGWWSAVGHLRRLAIPYVRARPLARPLL